MGVAQCWNSAGPCTLDAPDSIPASGPTLHDTRHRAPCTPDRSSEPNTHTRTRSTTLMTRVRARRDG
eukprot:636048-Prymnesium_polylepis.1